MREKGRREDVKRGGDKTHRASTSDRIWPTLLLNDDSSEVAILMSAEHAGTGSSAAAKLLPKEEGPGERWMGR